MLPVTNGLVRRLLGKSAELATSGPATWRFGSSSAACSVEVFRGPAEPVLQRSQRRFRSRRLVGLSRRTHIRKRRLACKRRDIIMLNLVGRRDRDFHPQSWPRGGRVELAAGGALPERPVIAAVLLYPRPALPYRVGALAAF